MVSFNYTNGEIVSSPTVIVSGYTLSGLTRGIVTFTNDNNKVFPPVSAEVNNGQFKIVVHVAPNEKNEFVVEVADNGAIDDGGYARFNGSPHVVDVGTLALTFNELPQNKPVHLCLIVGRDSQGTYDMPRYKLQRGENPSVDVAVRKLKVAARLMQAYTQDEMRMAGLSNRSFQFVEEITNQQGIFGYNVTSPAPHKEVKVHVLRSPKSVSEIRDINWAQQNPKALNSGGLFHHAIDLAKDYFKPKGSAIQCAVIYLDSVYDKQRDLILAHAALGGGGDVRMAIFGSHGIHSWPNTFAQVSPAFTDETPLSKAEVANDANQCGTSWECLNITLGAFMHEIGHLLRCPHQVNGVMLRDYIWFNRSFMTREARCLRENTPNNVIGRDGSWGKNFCHWNKLDLYRFLYHGSFSLPIDQFPKIASTILHNAPQSDAPSSYNDNNAAIFKSSSGIYLIELITDDLARQHIAFLPRAYGGSDPVTSYKLEFDKCRSMMNRDDFSVRVLGIGDDLYIDNFRDHCLSKKNEVRADLGLGRGKMTMFKSSLLGSYKDKETLYVGFDIANISRVRVYHNNALFGMRFYFTTGGGNTNGPPPVPRRDYLGKIMGKISNSLQPPNGGEKKETLFGNECGNYNDFDLQPGERIVKFNFRNGQWLDAVQFETDRGRVSGMFGSKGGHLLHLEAPSSDFTVVGVWGFVGAWIDGIGILYTRD